jgi:hypothetical protein
LLDGSVGVDLVAAVGTGVMSDETFGDVAFGSPR